MPRCFPADDPAHQDTIAGVEHGAGATAESAMMPRRGSHAR